jgi:hypothetical protein
LEAESINNIIRVQGLLAGNVKVFDRLFPESNIFLIFFSLTLIFSSFVLRFFGRASKRFAFTGDLWPIQEASFVGLAIQRGLPFLASAGNAILILFAFYISMLVTGLLVAHFFEVPLWTEVGWLTLDPFYIFRIFLSWRESGA